MDRRKVVIVDEEPEVAERAADIIRADGWQPMVVASGAEAFAIAIVERPWLIIVGEYLSDMAGDDLLARLWREIPAEERPRRLMLYRPNGADGFGRFLEVETILHSRVQPQELRAYVRRLHASLPGEGTSAPESVQERDS